MHKWPGTNTLIINQNVIERVAEGLALDTCTPKTHVSYSKVRLTYEFDIEDVAFGHALCALLPPHCRIISYTVSSFGQDIEIKFTDDPEVGSLEDDALQVSAD